MRAAVWEGPNFLAVREVSPPTPGAGEVLVGLRTAGICGSDLHVIEGRLPFVRPPRILGHELAGEIVEVGPGVSDLLPGARVAVSPVLSCARCFYCRRGAPHLCDSPRELGFTTDGGWRELFAVPCENCVPLPADVDWEAAALLEPLNCTLGAAMRLRILPGDDVLILGSGPGGLLFTQLMRLLGCGQILLAGRAPARQALGQAYGADHLLEAGAGVPERARALCDGMGPALVIEAVGTPETVAQAFRAVRRGGQVLLYGLCGAPLSAFDSDAIVLNALTVVGH
ncbi:MAG: alcohol dehydrogenase catalytic domain-containing protein, partial [candidate division NC10 bacterium]|nr:alcohol dehydrogenase catalytic domain-containing protein [candidate division NC10 bacterium]